MTDKRRQILDIAISNTESLICLVNDILDLERIKSGAIAMQKTQCNVEDLFVGSIQAMQSMAEQAKISLECKSISANLWADPE